MKRITTFAAFAVFVFLAGSSTAPAEQGNDTGPVRLNAPRGQAPVPAIKPIQENRIPKQDRATPAPGNVDAGQDEPQQLWRPDRAPVRDVGRVPSGGPQQVGARPLYRDGARRVNGPGAVHAAAVRWYHG